MGALVLLLSNVPKPHNHTNTHIHMLVSVYNCAGLVWRVRKIVSSIALIVQLLDGATAVVFVVVVFVATAVRLFLCLVCFYNLGCLIQWGVPLSNVEKLLPFQLGS